jgi:hypothetical protein
MFGDAMAFSGSTGDELTEHFCVTSCAGFAHAGQEVLTLEVGEGLAGGASARRGQRCAIMSAASEQLAKIVKRERIDATFGMWANGLTTYMHGMQEGKPATVFDLIGVPHVCYWLDAPHWAHSGAIQPYYRHALIASPMLTHVINNEATAEEMRRVLGFGRTIAQAYWGGHGGVSSRRGRRGRV